MTIQVGSFEVNCSILFVDGRAWVIDPGSEADRIRTLVTGRGLVLAGALLTHAHFDHISALPGLLAAIPDLPVYVTETDATVIGHPFNQYPPDYPPVARPERTLPPEGCPIEGLTVIETPGHTPGGVCYHLPHEKLLFAGDTLFAGSVGRTDLPGGDMKLLSASLEKLKTLPDDTLVIPGHGPFTTIGEERRSNPFLR